MWDRLHELVLDELSEAEMVDWSRCCIDAVAVRPKKGGANRAVPLPIDPPFRPSLEEATQALGICFTADRRIVLVTWNGEDWTLPGGAPEPGETLEQALAREVREEACARVVSSRYIGCQRVEELDGDRVAYYQTRFWARVALHEFKPEHEMMARRLVSPQEFCGTLFWGEEATAHLILDRGLATEEDLRKRDRETW